MTKEEALDKLQKLGEELDSFATVMHLTGFGNTATRMNEVVNELADIHKTLQCWPADEVRDAASLIHVNVVEL